MNKEIERQKTGKACSDALQLRLRGSYTAHEVPETHGDDADMGTINQTIDFHQCLIDW